MVWKSITGYKKLHIFINNNSIFTVDFKTVLKRVFPWKFFRNSKTFREPWGRCHFSTKIHKIWRLTTERKEIEWCFQSSRKCHFDTISRRHFWFIEKWKTWFIFNSQCIGAEWPVIFEKNAFEILRSPYIPLSWIAC